MAAVQPPRAPRARTAWARQPAQGREWREKEAVVGTVQPMEMAVEQVGGWVGLGCGSGRGAGAVFGTAALRL